MLIKAEIQPLQPLQPLQVLLFCRREVVITAGPLHFWEGILSFRSPHLFRLLWSQQPLQVKHGPLLSGQQQPKVSRALEQAGVMGEGESKEQGGSFNERYLLKLDARPSPARRRPQQHFMS